MNNDKYISDKYLANRLGVSRPTIWRWVRESIFPNPKRFSKGVTRWKLSDIEKWEAEK